MSQLQSTSGSLGYRTFGSGPDIVLLRGLGRWSEHWNNLDQDLAKSCRVTVIDSKGYGLSKHLRSNWNQTIEQMAEDVCVTVRAANLKQPTLLGVSLGGMIALAATAQQPNLFSRVIVVNSSMGGSPYPRIRKMSLLGLIWRIPFKGALYRYLAECLLGPDCNDTEKQHFIDTWRTIDSAHGLNLLEFIKQIVAAIKFRNQTILTKIQIPAFIIKGESDQFVDPRNSEWIAPRIAGSKIFCANRGGHELSFECKEWFLKTIQTCLNF
jgi:pimeloyl-ACP methyl ester carboxylesterase